MPARMIRHRRTLATPTPRTAARVRARMAALAEDLRLVRGAIRCASDYQAAPAFVATMEREFATLRDEWTALLDRLLTLEPALADQLAGDGPRRRLSAA